MPITVGHDTAKTRKTLSDGDQSIAYYSIPAATEAGLGDFSKLPAALKVVFYALNMTRRLPSTTSKHSLHGVLKAARIHAKSHTALPACFCNTSPASQP